MTSGLGWGAALAATLLLGAAAWAGCGDETCLCDAGGGSAGASGVGGAGGAAGAGGTGGAGEASLYVRTAEGRQLRAWRKGPDDNEPLLLGEVAAKADPYGGNPFGAAYVLVDAQYVYFADVGTVAGFNPDAVQLSNGDGAVYRVAR